MMFLSKGKLLKLCRLWSFSECKVPLLQSLVPGLGSVDCVNLLSSELYHAQDSPQSFSHPQAGSFSRFFSTRFQWSHSLFEIYAIPPSLLIHLFHSHLPLPLVFWSLHSGFCPPYLYLIFTVAFSSRFSRSIDNNCCSDHLSAHISPRYSITGLSTCKCLVNISEYFMIS